MAGWQDETVRVNNEEATPGQRTGTTANVFLSPVNHRSTDEKVHCGRGICSFDYHNAMSGSLATDKGIAVLQPKLHTCGYNSIFAMILLKRRKRALCE